MVSTKRAKMPGIVIFIFISCIYADNVLNTKRIIHSIEKLVNYYEESYTLMNIDGIYGLRLLEGQISSLLDDFHAEKIRSDIHTETFTKLETLHGVMSNIIRRSLNHVRNSDINYFELMGAVLEKRITMETDFYLIDPSLRWSKRMTKTKGYSYCPDNARAILTTGFTETFTDMCMSELLGTSKAGTPPCSPSTRCMSKMFERGHLEYTITHQLLYTILAKQEGCEKELLAYISDHETWKTVEDVQQEFCTNNLFEMVELIGELPDQTLPEIYQDLFMEQQLVCPWLGYMQFLHVSWLDQILSWQRPSGCFGKESLGHDQVGAPLKDKLDANGDEKGRASQGVQHLPREDHEVVIQAGVGRSHGLHLKIANKTRSVQVAAGIHPDIVHMGRKLLEERELSDGCGAHRTAVAAGALSQYLKFTIYAYPPSYAEKVHMYGPNYLLYDTWEKILNLNNDHQNEKGILGMNDFADSDSIAHVGVDSPVLRKEYEQPHQYYDQGNDNANYRADNEANEDEEDDANDTQDYYEDINNKDRNLYAREPYSDLVKFVPNNFGERLNMAAKYRIEKERNRDYEGEKDSREDYDDQYEDEYEQDLRKKGPGGNMDVYNDLPENPKFQGVLKYPNQNVPLQGNRIFPPVERNEDDDPGYNYYEAPVQDPKMARNFETQSTKQTLILNKPDTNSIINNGANNAKAQALDNMQVQPVSAVHAQNEVSYQALPSKHELVPSLSYLLLLVPTFILLFFMFKFVRAKRIIIRYRYG